MSSGTHPLYPPLHVPFPGGVWGTFNGAHDGGAAPLSPVLQGAIVGLDGMVTPPPSPGPSSVILEMEREMQAIDDSTPCPGTPYVVPDPEADDVIQSAYNAFVEYQPPQWVETTPGVFVHYSLFTDPYATTGGAGLVPNRGHAQHDSTGSGSQAQGYTPVQHTILRGQANAPKLTDHVDPVFAMIYRYLADHEGHDEFIEAYKNQDSDISTRIPSTGIRDVDKATTEYYSTKPHETYLRQFGSYISYYYPVEVVQTVLQKDWHLVRPQPIPAVILKTFDYVGPNHLKAGQDGWAYIVPTEDTIWGTVLERGVNSHYKPLAKDRATSESIPVQTTASVCGAAVYPPQDIVASKFAVNVFREVPMLPGTGASRDVPMAEYLGAYILKYADDMCMPQSAWNNISQEIKDMLADQAPHLFEGFPPYVRAPPIPVVSFCFYRWDPNMVGLADETHESYRFHRAAAIINREDADHEDHDEDLFSDDQETSSDGDSSFLDMDSA